MKTFNEWLVERDPEMSEALGLRTLARGAKWVAKKGIPFAVQAGLTLNDPVSLTLPQKPDAPLSPSRPINVPGDDYGSMELNRRRAERDEKMKQLARQKAAMGGGKPPMPSPGVI